MINIPNNLSNALVITSKEFKDSLVKKAKEYNFVNVKIISNIEFYKNIYLNIDKRAIVRIMELHNDISFEHAKKIYQVLKYVGVGIDDEYLTSILNELKKDNLVHQDDYFVALLKSRSVYVDEAVLVDSISNYLDSNKIKYEVLDNHDVNLLEKKVYQFTNAYEELNYVYNQIAALLDQGIDINKIAIYGLDDEYRFYIDYMSAKYHFDVDFPSSQSAYASILGKEILELLESKTIEETYELLNEEYKDNEVEKKNIYKILNELTYYRSDVFSKEKQLEIYHSIIKDYSLTSLHKKNAVKVLKSPIIDDSLYIFAVNFTIDLYPRIANNDTIISTEEYVNKHIYNVDEVNQIEKNKILLFLSQDNIALISRKAHGLASKNYDPSILKNYQMKRVTLIQLDKTQYSEDVLSNTLGIIYDKKDKYRQIDKNQESIEKKVKVDFKTYDNAFNMPPLFKDNSPVALSYSQLNNYVMCPYSFYLDRVLLKKEQSDVTTTFAIEVGNLAHKVLELYYTKPDFDYDKDFDEVRKTYAYNAKELMLLERIKDDLRVFVNFLKENDALLNADIKVKAEQEFRIELAENIFLKGKLDKIYDIKVNNEHYLAVIDYKSRVHEFSSKKVPYGGELQLPTYLFILNNTKQYKDKKIIGLFYQCNLPKEISKEATITGDTYAQGIYTNDYDRLSIFGPYINPTKLNRIAKGKTPDTKKGQIFFSDEELDKLSIDVKKVYLETANNIKNNRFEIAPKKFGSENEYCTYCDYKDICYKKSSDINQITFDDVEEESEA